MGKFINRKVISFEQEKITVRYCSKCGKDKPISEFHKGVRYCKPCKKIYRHERYLLNKKHENKLSTKYFKEHKTRANHYRHVKLGYKPKIECKFCLET